MYAKLKNEYSALNVDSYQNLFINIYTVFSHKMSTIGIFCTGDLSLHLVFNHPNFLNHEFNPFDFYRKNIVGIYRTIPG